MRVRNRFASLALPHLAAIYRLARQLAGPDRADDLTQETFLNAATLIHDESLLGRNIVVRGRLFRNSRSLVVESYELGS